MIGEESLRRVEGFGNHSAFGNKQAKTDECRGQLAVRVLSYKFAGALKPPKIYSCALKKFTRGVTEERDQRIRIGFLGSVVGKP
jgi:hypothetical protein